MSALVLTLIVSLVLAAAAVGLMVWTIYQGTHEHHDRLALIPLDEEVHPPDSAPAESPLSGSTASSHQPNQENPPKDQ